MQLPEIQNADSRLSEMNRAPFVRQVRYTCTKEWGTFIMPKGIPKKGTMSIVGASKDKKFKQYWISSAV